MNDMQLKFETGNNKEYKVDGIWDNAVYAKELAGQLPGLYYLVLWKGYPKEENTWKPTLAIQHLQKLVTAYHNDNPEKPTATSAPVNIALSMARPSTSPRPTAKPTTDITIKRKQSQVAEPTAAPAKKRGQLARPTTTTKRAKQS